MQRVWWLAIVLLIASCSGDLGQGSLSFKARFPDRVRFTESPASYRTQGFTDTIEISTVRLTAVRDGSVAATHDFAAVDRQGELINLTEGTYEIRVEGLAGDKILLRGIKTGVVIESARVRDAGEFFLAPVAPARPVLTLSPRAVTNIAEVVLSGEKEMFTGININGSSLLEPDGAKAFTVRWTLASGENALRITEVNPEGVEGPALTLSVTLDKTPPRAVSFGVAGAPAAVSNATLTLLIAADEAAEMMIAASANFSGAVWIPYESSVTLTLRTPDGAQTLYAKFRDTAGNESAALSTRVVLDTVAPAMPDIAAAALTNSPNVNLSIVGTGANFIDFWEAGRTAVTRVPFVQTLPITLSAGDGAKPISVRLADAAGNLSPVAVTTVTLDTVAPTGTAVGITGAPAFISSLNVSLDLMATGATEMQVAADPAFTGASWVPFSTTTFLPFVAADGPVTFYARFRDAAGNVSVAVSTTVTLDMTVPTGSVALQGAPAAVSSTAVTLVLTASPDAADVQVSEDPAFTAAVWQAFSTSLPFTLSGVDGGKTVYARFRDGAGNISATPAQISVTLDMTAPVPVNLAVLGSPAEISTTTVTLDANATGAVEMQLSESATFVGATWEPYSVAASFGLVAGDGVKTVYVRFRDALGNTSGSLSTTVTLDSLAPTGTAVVVTGAPAYITSLSVSLDLTATGATELQVAADAAFTGASWIPFSPTTLLPFVAADGPVTFYARFRDAVGNVSSAVSTTVTLDITVPIGSVALQGAPMAVASTGVTLELSASADVTNVQASEDPGFAAAAWVPYSTSLMFWLTPVEGLKTIYVRFLDAAGNISVPSVQASVLFDWTSPTVTTFAILGSPTAVSTASVTLQSAATDAAALEVRYGADPSFASATSFASVTPTYGYILGAEGLNSIYAQFRDTAGNVTVAGPLSITLDTTPPSGVMGLNVTPSPSNGGFTLSWNASVDTGAGVAFYTIEESLDTLVWSPAGTTAGTTLDLIRPDGLYYFRVAAVDGVGLMGSASSSVPETIDSLPPLAGFVYDGLSIDLQFVNTAGSIASNWNGFSDAGGIVSYAWGLGTTPFVADVLALTNVGLSQSATTAATLVEGATYYVTVRAYDAAGNFADAASNGFLFDSLAPGVPGTPTAFPSPATSTFDVSWTASSDAGSGVAQYELDEIGYLTYPVTGTAFTRFSPGEGVYNFRVRAIDMAGNISPWSATGTTLVDQTGPSAPTSVAFAQNPSNGPVALSWGAAFDSLTSVAYYEVGQSIDGGITYLPVTTTAGLSYSTTLTAGTYYFQVTPVDAAGNFGSPGFASVTIDTMPPIGGTVNDGEFGDVAYSASATSVAANWLPFTDDGGISSFAWAVGTTPFGTDIQPFVNVGLALSASTTASLNDGQYYYVTVRGYDYAGNFIDAASNGFIVDSLPPAVPGTPVGAPNPANGQFTVTWSASSDAVSGLYQYELDEIGYMTLPVTTNTYIKFSPLEGSRDFRVRAVDNVGNVSAWSATGTTLVDLTPPFTPTGVSFSSNPSTGSTILTWFATTDLLTGVADYSVEQSPEGFTWAPIATVTGTTYPLALSEGTYYFQIAARDGAGNLSMPSSPVSLLVDQTAPVAGLVNDGLGMDLDAVTSATSVEANWDFIDANGIEHFDLAVGTAPGDASVYAFTNQGSSLSATATGLSMLDGLTYYVTVRAYDFAGNMVEASSDGFVVDSTPPPAPTALAAAPTPNAGSFTVNWSAVTDAVSGTVTQYEVEDVGFGSQFTSGTVVSVSRIEGSYQFRVRAYDAGGLFSAWSLATTVVVDQTPPTPPGTPTFSANPVSGPVTVSWTASTDSGGAGLAHYVMAESSDGFTWFDVATTANTSVVRTLGGGAYTYKVRAVDFVLNVGAESGMSLPLTVTTNGPTAPYVAIPGSPSAVSTITVPIVLSALGATEYQVSEDPGFNAVPWQSMVSNTTFNLSAGDGLKTIFARYRNALLSPSSVTSTSVNLDQTAPAFSGVDLAGGASAVSNATVSLGLLAGGDSAQMAVTGDVIPPKSGWQPFQALSSITLSTATGMITGDFSGGADVINGLVVQPDGKIVAVGNTSSNLGDIIVMRFLADGKLDTTFASTGKRVIDIGLTNNYAYAVTMQTDGKIVIAGSTNDGFSQNFLAIRLNADGTNDTTFDLDGVATVAVGTGSNLDEATAIAMQPDGSIVEAGYVMTVSGYDFAVVRWTNAGALDTTFNGTGYLNTDMQTTLNDIARGVAIQPDGKIVVAGQSGNGTNNEFALARYTSSGILDSTFGTAGKTITAFGTGNDEAWGMHLDPDGKIVLAGRAYITANANYDFAAARYSSAGTLDTSFGTGGMMTFAPAPSGNDQAFAVLGADNGGYVLGGQTGALDALVIRLLPNGAVDSAFGAGGMAGYAGPNADIGKALAPTSLGRFVFAGATNPGLDDDGLVVRYWPDGTKDGSFGQPLEGSKNVFVRVRDALGNMSPELQSSVAYDITPPMVTSYYILGYPTAVSTASVNLQMMALGADMIDLAEDPNFVGATTLGFTTSWNFTLSGGDGTKTIWARFSDYAGNSTTTSLSILKDSVAPLSGSVQEGLAGDLQWQNQSTSISANWTGFADLGGSGISAYWMAIGTTPGGTDVLGFTNKGLAVSATQGGLSLLNGSTYYVSIKAVDQAGNAAVATSNGVTVDNTTPLVGIVNDGLSADVQFWTDPAQLNANWSGFSDPESGVQGYEWAIGTLPGSTSVMAFTPVGLTTSAMQSGLSLTNGTTYYVTVRVTNGAGVMMTASSDGFMVDVVAPSPPGTPSASPNPTSTSVNLTWAASSDLESGIKSYRVEWSTDFIIWTAVTNATIPSNAYSFNQVGDGTYWYRVNAADNAGNTSTFSATALPVTVDSMPPGPGFVNDGISVDIDFQSDTATLSANWMGFTDAALNRYEVAVGTTPGATDMAGFTSVGISTSYSAGHALVVGTTYYVTVRAFDNAGNTTYATSNGVTVAHNIASITPQSGGAFDQVDIVGDGFGASQGASTVWFGGVTATVLAWSSTYVQVWVPTGLASGVYDIKVRVNGFDSNTFPFTIEAPMQMVFTSLPKNLTAGQCSSTSIDIQTQDGSYLARGVTVATTINLNAPNLGLYSSFGCTGPLGPSTVLPAGQSTLSVYVMAITAGTQMLEASANGLGVITQNEYVTAALATQLVFVDPPVSITASTCTPFNIEAHDPYGNLDETASTYVNISGGSAVFYYDMDCVGAASNELMTSGIITLYVLDLAVEILTLTVSDVNVVLSPAVTTVTVTPAAAIISSVTPSAASIGSMITINGSQFGVSSGTVFFGGTPTMASSWTNTQIQVRVPNMPFGLAGVHIERGLDLVSSNTVAFMVAPPCCAPFITSINPATAPSNALVTISGFNFGDPPPLASVVRFGGVAANVQQWFANAITVQVPMAAAPGTIYVDVVTGQSSNLVAFEHLRPWIDGRFPATVTVGTLVNLAGRYFGMSQGTLYVGPTPVPVAAWNETNIQFTWPGGMPKGYRPVTVATVSGLSTNAVQINQRGSDVWLPLGETPEGRAQHTAVWTGAEMIVWGGDSADWRAAGGRYNPATDSWLPTSVNGEPVARYLHSAVWTGKEMIVWGGSGSASYMQNGGRYDPAKDTWSVVSNLGTPPAGRQAHSAVWTGTKMVIWGGTQTGGLTTNTGGIYDPIADTWTATSTGANVPSARDSHTAVWTGKIMVVWGGYGGAYLGDGGRYDPQTDTWLMVSSTGAPLARAFHTAVWTGNEMIVWGGNNGVTVYNDGARYDPVADTWSAMLTPGVLPVRNNHTAVWTGSKMIVWGGKDTSSYQTGGVYDPKVDSWVMTGVDGNTPSSRHYHTAVWTGKEMVVWGGRTNTTAPFDYLDSGGRYNPDTNSWVPTALEAHPPVAASQTSVWTGTQMIVWGGKMGATYVNTGGRYDPVTNTWLPTDTAGSLPGRQGHSAVWSGLEMIVYGGAAGAAAFSDGKRYNPSSNSWMTIPPTTKGRMGHAAVLLPDGKMLVAGGIDSAGAYVTTSELYDPGTNVWSAGGGMVSAHVYTSIVMYNGKAYVWGGMMSPTSASANGDIYTPQTNTWASMALSGLTARAYHVAVTNGTKMAVFGGGNASTSFGDGAVYDLAGNTWTTMNITGAPIARKNMVAVGVNGELIVWGGENNSSQWFNDGARYDILGNSWKPMATGQYVPAVRGRATGVWTGSEMLIWGGGNSANYEYASGARYVP